MFYKSYSQKNGFTLVEVIVVTAVIGILAAVLIPNLRQGEENTRLIRVAQQIVQDIRDAQNMALSSTEVYDACQEGEWAVCDYYGIYLDKQDHPSSYYIFGSNNASYNSGEEIKIKQIEENVIVYDISTGNKADITFNPPYSSVNFSPSATSVTITLKTQEAGSDCPEDCVYIEIDNNGWISVKRTPGEEGGGIICEDGDGSDDPDCGIIDCSGWYVQEGIESATTTEECYNKEDITSERCEGIGDCKDSNSSDCDEQPNDELQYSCGVCQYIDDSDCDGTTLGSCSNYSEGTDCGSGMECDGAGNCVESVVCPDGAGSDDEDCGIIDCSNWYEQTGTESATETEYCYNKEDITSERCEGEGDCKDSNSSDCDEQTNDELQYDCGICQYIDDSDCDGATLGSCSNYPEGTDCGGDKECDGSGSCVDVGHVYLNPEIDETPLECSDDVVNKYCDSYGWGCTNWDWTCGENPQDPECKTMDNPNCEGSSTTEYICPTAVTQITCH